MTMVWSGGKELIQSRRAWLTSDEQSEVMVAGGETLGPEGTATGTDPPAMVGTLGAVVGVSGTVVGGDGWWVEPLCGGWGGIEET